MADPFGPSRHFDSRTIPGWRKVTKALLFILMGWPVAHAGLLSLVLGIGLNLPPRFLLATAALMEAGGIVVIVGLYLGTESPTKSVIRPLALASLLAGFAAVALSLGNVSMWLMAPGAEVPEELKGIALFLGFAGFGFFVLSHLLSLAYIAAADSYSRRARRVWFYVAYAATFMLLALGVAAVLVLSTLPVFANQEWGVRGRLLWPIPLSLDEAKEIGAIVLLLCGLFVNAWFMYVALRVRKAVKRMISTTPGVTDSLSSSSPSPPSAPRAG